VVSFLNVVSFLFFFASFSSSFYCTIFFQQFTAYLTFQYEYRDTALEYATISPKRSIIFGDESLREKIWAPNIFMKDEDETTVVSIEEKDVIVSIAPSGSVTYTYKMVAKFYCWMNLKKFPFDTQRCSLAFSDCKH
jgi:hypothetical protein